MWDLLGSGVNLSPKLAGRFFSIEPPGKPDAALSRPMFFENRCDQLFLQGSFLDIRQSQSWACKLLFLFAVSFTYSSDDTNARMDTFQGNEQFKMLPV